jgi:hypothetical protein
MSLPVIRDGLDELAVIDPDTGELAPLRDASDRALAHAAQKLAEHDSEVYAMKRALAHELRARHGVGKAEAGGFAWVVAESTSWPAGAVKSVLEELVREGVITEADAKRCFPPKPTPNAVQLKALIGRLTVGNPVAAKRLAGAATVSPPSVREVHVVAVDEDVAA